VFEQLTVFENLELALKTPKGVKASMFFKLDSGQSDRLAEVLAYHPLGRQRFDASWQFKPWPKAVARDWHVADARS
jgi:ABC-type uncharacterized transport system ATPase subunit